MEVTCRADINGDDALNSTDISDYITRWLACIATGDLAADLNGDGVVNSSDVSAFITSWLSAVLGGGC